MARKPIELASPRPTPAAHFMKRIPWRLLGQRFVVMLLSIGLLTLAFAPVGQFYLAWIALVPFWVMISRVESRRWAIVIAWLTAYLFFAANMWWLIRVTGPGSFALWAILAVQWAICTWIVRAFGWFTPIDSADLSSQFRRCLHVLLFAMVWTGAEVLRGNFPWNGLPWLFLGHSQSPALVICQMADAVGVPGISFWVAVLNAVGVLFVVEKRNFAKLKLVMLMAAIVSVAIVSYGIVRIRETATTPGPRVMLVQSNYPQSNTGEKGASEDTIIDFHVLQTQKALMKDGNVDLVVWSETMMPPLNRESLVFSQGTRLGARWQRAFESIESLARENKVAILAGSTFCANWTDDGPRDRRNSAYFFEPTGFREEARYDKIHLVPFGEFMPFRDSFPLLYRFLMVFSPYQYDYSLTPGNLKAVDAFKLKMKSQQAQKGTEIRFVSPICFEDLDANLIAKMFDDGGNKRADMIVNLTNDGWFAGSERPLHLQAAIFRSIENRVPTVRSVNTGISGFIDSTGRTHDLLPSSTEGMTTAQVQLDPRYTLFSKVGDLFGFVCLAGTGIIAVIHILMQIKRRRAVRALSSPGATPNS